VSTGQKSGSEVPGWNPDWKSGSKIQVQNSYICYIDLIDRISFRESQGGPICYIDLIDLIDRIAFSEPGPVVHCYIDLIDRIDRIAFRESQGGPICYIDLIDRINRIAYSYTICPTNTATNPNLS
jgi:hypothetical protein